MPPLEAMILPLVEVIFDDSAESPLEAISVSVLRKALPLGNPTNAAHTIHAMFKHAFRLSDAVSGETQSNKRSKKEGWCNSQSDFCNRHYGSC